MSDNEFEDSSATHNPINENYQIPRAVLSKDAGQLRSQEKLENSSKPSDGSWVNPGFDSDELNNYQIPPVELNRSPVANNDVEAGHLKILKSPVIGSLEDPENKGSPQITPGDDEPEDYSLRSYFKHLQMYREMEEKIAALFKMLNITNFTRKLVMTSLAILYVIYFLAMLVIVSKEAEDESYWCNGDGFVIIITSFTVIFLIYFQIVKPLYGEKVGITYNVVKQGLGPKLGWFKIAVKICILVAIIVFYVIDSASDRSRLTSIFGMVVLVFLGFIFSKAPRKVLWSQVMWGLFLQFIMGLLILRWSVGREIFSCVANKVDTFLKFTDEGSKFVYGRVVDPEFPPVFAFKILSVIFFFSFCIQILYHLGAMQWIVMKLGWLLHVSVGTTACESVNAAANIFLGQSEAPLLIKPFLPSMTKSELHAVLTGGFATIAGGVLAAFISFGIDPAHLLSASVMSAPAALGISKLIYPEVEESITRVDDIKVVKGKESNVIHAAFEGVISAIPLFLNIIASLIAIIAFMAFADSVLNWFCSRVNIGGDVCALSSIFGYIFMPLAWIMGVPWQDCYIVGQLIGTKTFINEFVGYIELGDHIKKKELMKRSEIIATYALCGFSNIGSIGIQLGAMGAMVPKRKGDLAKLAVSAMIAGSTACFLTACVAGSLISVELEESLETNGTVSNIQ